jgi:hypothetical protein
MYKYMTLFYRRALAPIYLVIAEMHQVPRLGLGIKLLPISGFDTQTARPLNLRLRQFLVFGILLGSPLAVAKAAATIPGVHTEHEI